MAVKKKDITIAVTSNAQMESYDITINGNSKTDSVVTTSSGITSTLSLNENTETTEKIYQVVGKGIYKNHTYETPIIEIKQDEHPDYYDLAYSAIREIGKEVDSVTPQSVHIGEFETEVIISAYAINRHDSSDLLVNSDYFTLDYSGDVNIIKISEPMEYEDMVEWSLKIGANPTNEDRTSTIQLTFNPLTNGPYKSTLKIKQDKHTPVLSNVILDVDKTELPANGGQVVVTASYVLDGVKKGFENLNVAVSDQTLFPSTDYSLVQSTTYQWVVNVLPNSTESNNGFSNRSFYIFTQNPLNGETIASNTVHQLTQKQSVYNFSFDGGELSKNIRGLSSSSQEITTSLISNKVNSSGETVNLGVALENKPDYITSFSYQNGQLHLFLSNNPSPLERSCTITIYQLEPNGSQSPMDSLTLAINQLGTQNTIPEFDYCILQIGSDSLSGTDMDIIINAVDYGIVGKEKGLGDTATLAYGGNNTSNGLESALLNAKNILTEEFITLQTMQNKKSFDVEIYISFQTLGSGVVTCKMLPYNGGEAVKVSNPSDGNGSSAWFVKGEQSSLLNWDEKTMYHHAIVSSENGAPSNFKSTYTLIGTYKFSYDSRNWSWSQTPSTIINSLETLSTVGNGRNYNIVRLTEASRSLDIANQSIYCLWGDDVNDGNVLNTRFVFSDNAMYGLDIESPSPSFHKPHIIYDQTEFCLVNYAVATTSATEESACLQSVGTQAYSSMLQLMTQQVLWLDFNDYRALSKKTIVKDVYYEGAWYPTDEVKGILINLNGIQSTFSINGGTTNKRAITFTVYGSTGNMNEYVTFQNFLNISDLVSSPKISYDGMVYDDMIGSLLYFNNNDDIHIKWSPNAYTKNVQVNLNFSTTRYGEVNLARSYNESVMLMAEVDTPDDLIDTPIEEYYDGFYNGGTYQILLHNQTYANVISLLANSSKIAGQFTSPDEPANSFTSEINNAFTTNDASYVSLYWSLQVMDRQTNQETKLMEYKTYPMSNFLNEGKIVFNIEVRDGEIVISKNNSGDYEQVMK